MTFINLFLSSFVVFISHYFCRQVHQLVCIMQAANCAICKQHLVGGKPTVTLTQKGAAGINEASSKQTDDVSVNPGGKVHQDCRRDY